MKLYRFSAILLIGIWSCNNPQEAKDVEVTEKGPYVEYGSPGSAGFNSDSLKNIDDMIKRLTEEGKIPGAAALLASDGKIIYQTAYGKQDIEAGTDLDTTVIFRIASMSKPITSVAILQLYEQGKLKLDDPVHKYIPSFLEPEVITSFNKQDTTWTSRKASREVTIHDLLTHTAGVAYGFVDERFSAIYAKNNIPDLAVASDKTIAETTDAIGGLPLVHDPGEKFTYGLNTDILGRVVEVASGMGLEHYVHENITAPLQMNDTRYFYDDEGVRERLATVYIIEDSALKKMEPTEIYDPEYPVSGAKKYYSGGSGMSSTLQDYFIFCQAILNGGEYNGERILQDSTVDLMLSDKLGELRFADNNTFGYGMRIVREKDDSGNVGDIVELSWGGAFNTYYFINPSEQTIGIIMSQVLMNPYGMELNNGFNEAVKSAHVSQVLAELE